MPGDVVAVVKQPTLPVRRRSDETAAHYHRTRTLAHVVLFAPTTRFALVFDVDRYLDHISWTGPISHDRECLEALQRAHLSTVAFENLYVVAGIEVRTDVEWAWTKVVEEGRGGWCFELNGLFAELLTALGFEARRIGAAVQLQGPNEMIDHCTVEVLVPHPDDARPWPHLVDVGFGDNFVRPLDLTSARPQDGGVGDFQFFASPRGTTLARLVDGVPEAQFRFKRVSLQAADFDSASQRLQQDETGLWRTKPFATKLLDGGPDRVTLLRDRLRVTREGELSESPVDASEWGAVLEHWFGMSPV